MLARARTAQCRWSTRGVRPVRHSQKRLAPMALLGLFSYACARASTARDGALARWSTQGVRPLWALAKTPCADGAARSFFLCPRSCKHGAGLGCLPGGARKACAPVRHSQKQPCCALSLFHLCSLFYTCGVGSVGMIPPRWSTRGVRPLWALAKAAVLRTVSFCPRLSALYAPRYGARISPVEHAEHAPPFGTRKNALRRWRCSIFFSYACARASTARGWDVCPVEHAGRAPPFGTRKSSRAAHCLFFICAHSSTPAA